MPFFSCYVNEIPLSSPYNKIREILGTDKIPYMLDHSTLRYWNKCRPTLDIMGDEYHSFFECNNQDDACGPEEKVHSCVLSTYLKNVQLCKTIKTS